MKKISLLVVFVLLVSLLTSVVSVSADTNCSLVFGYYNFEPIYTPANLNEFSPNYYMRDMANSITGQGYTQIDSHATAQKVDGAEAKFYISEAGSYDVWFRFRNGNRLGEVATPDPAPARRMFRAKVDNNFLLNGSGGIKSYGEDLLSDPDSQFGNYWEKASVTLTQGWHTLTVDTTVPNLHSVRYDMAFVTNQTYTEGTLPNDTTAFGNGIGAYADITPPTISSLSFGDVQLDTTMSRLLSWTASDALGIVKYEILNCTGTVIANPAPTASSHSISLPLDLNFSEDFVLRAYDAHNNITESLITWEGAISYYEKILIRPNFRDTDGVVKDVTSTNPAETFVGENIYFEGAKQNLNAHATAKVYSPEDGDYTLWFRTRTRTRDGAEERNFSAKINGNVVTKNSATYYFGKKFADTAGNPLGWYWDSAEITLNEGLNTVMIDAGGRDFVRVDMAFITNRDYLVTDLPTTQTAFDLGFRKYTDAVDPILSAFELVNAAGGNFEFSWSASDDKIISAYEIYNGASLVRSLAGSETGVIIPSAELASSPTCTLRAYDAHGNYAEGVVSLPSTYTEIVLSAENFHDISNLTKNVNGESLISGGAFLNVDSVPANTYATARVYIPQTGSYDLWVRFKTGNKFADSGDPIPYPTDRRLRMKIDNIHVEEGGVAKFFGQSILNNPNAAFQWYWESAAVTMTQGWHDITLDAYGCAYIRFDMAFITDKTYTAAQLPADTSSYGLSLKAFEDFTAPIVSTFIGKSKNGTSLNLSWAATDNKNIVQYELYNGSTKIETFAANILEYQINNLPAYSSYSYTLKAYDMHGNVSEKVLSGKLTDYYIEGITFNNPTLSTASVVTAVIENNTAANIDAFLIFALYDDGGRMIYVNTDAKTAIAPSASKVTLTANLSGYTGSFTGAYAKALLWDSDNGMKPATSERYGINLPQ